MANAIVLPLYGISRLSQSARVRWARYGAQSTSSAIRNALLFTVVAICGFMISTGYAKEPCGAHSDLAYIHFAQFEPCLGGKAGAVEIYYIASDGVTQSSSEMTDDRIGRLRIGRVSVDKDCFDHVFKLASVPLSPDLLDHGVVFDSSPSRMRLLVCRYDGTARFWEGEAAEAPDSIVEAITVVKAYIEQAVPETIGNASRFLRVRQMSKHPSQLRPRSYIVPSSNELRPGGLLATAIRHPYRLIPFSKDDDTPFAYRRQPERPVSAVIEDVAYRIHFLKLTEIEKEGKR